MLLLVACVPVEVTGLAPSSAQAPAVTVSLRVRPGVRDLIAPTVAVDPQGDTLSVSYAWKRNGEPVEAVEGRVPATEVWPGDVWTVTVAAEDPDGNRGEATADATIPEPLGGNVLVIMLDDVGVDKLTLYGLFEGAPTPVLDSLAAQGARFTAAWAYPTCSPTRAAALSGRHPFRHGTGHLVDMATSAYAHPLESVFVPVALREARGGQPWTSLALGKWHLAGDQAPAQLSHPLDVGFSAYAGSPGYLNEGVPEYQGYFVWRKNIDGVAETSATYNTTDTVNDVLATLPALPSPWFAWVAFNAAHTPFHTPPAGLFTKPLPKKPAYADKYEAMLEALDTELGRMFDGLPPDLLAETTIIVIGDNGTSDLVAVEFEPSQSKGSVFEGGVRVPLIVVSPHLSAPGRVIDTPVMAVDLFPTVLDLAGVPLSDLDGALVLPREDGEVAIDGASWVSLLTEPTAAWTRSLVYTELLEPNGPPPWNRHTRALSDGRYKLHRPQAGVESLYDLWDMDGLNQTDDLLLGRLNDEEESAYSALSVVLDENGLDDQFVGY